MNTSNEGAPSSLVRTLERMATRQRARSEELARRTKQLEEQPPLRRRTWRETKTEILGRRE